MARKQMGDRRSPVNSEGRAAGFYTITGFGAKSARAYAYTEVSAMIGGLQWEPPVTTLVAGSILIAAFSRQLADEFKAWTPWLIRKLVAFAVRRLPADRQERYSEEWTSYIEEIPGEIGKILAALTLPLGAMAMRIEFRRKARAAANAKPPYQWQFWLRRLLWRNFLQILASRRKGTAYTVGPTLLRSDERRDWEHVCALDLYKRICANGTCAQFVKGKDADHKSA